MDMRDGRIFWGIMWASETVNNWDLVITYGFKPYTMDMGMQKTNVFMGL